MATYVADVRIEIELDGVEATDEEAFKVIDNILQRAWDTDQGRAWMTRKWHFEMLEGCVTEIDEGLADDLRLIRKFNDDGEIES